MYYDERENNMNYNSLEEVNNYNEYNFVNKDEKKWDNDFKFDINSININNYRDSLKLYPIAEGFNKGNMFVNEYIPYKNYIYKVVVKGEKDTLLLNIQELTFKVKDLGLYLDIHPSDIEAFNIYKDSVKKLKELKSEYEKNYGPLCSTDTLYYSEYKWLKSPWPWVNEGGKK